MVEDHGSSEAGQLPKARTRGRKERKRNRATCLDYQIVRGERVKVSESRTLAREGDQSRSM